MIKLSKKYSLNFIPSSIYHFSHFSLFWSVAVNILSLESAMVSAYSVFFAHFIALRLPINGFCNIQHLSNSDSFLTHFPHIDRRKQWRFELTDLNKL